MKWLYTGDLHLTAASADEYRWDVFEWLARYAENLEAERIVILGDLTDLKDKHPARLVNRVVAEIDELPVPVTWLLGNHDYVDPAEPFFKFLDGLSEDIDFIMEPTLYEDGDVLALPHTRDPMKEWRKIDEGVRKAAKFVLMHQTLDKSVASNGVKLPGLSLKWLRKMFPNATFISGDIHVPQSFSKGRFWYTGSPHAVRFGDNYKPRVLFFDGTKVRSLARHNTVQKRKILVTSPDEDMAEWFDGMHEGDQAKIYVKLPRSRYGEWSDVKSALLEEADTRGILVRSCELERPRIARRRVREGQPPEPEISREMPAQTLSRYVREVTAPDTKVGARIVTEVLAAFPIKEIAPGDVDVDALVIEGFRSFGQDQILRLDSGPGLYMLHGRNEEYSRIGPNGTGKSSTWDALVWTFFGKTARGVYGGNVVNWSGEYVCSNYVEFTKSGVHYSLCRTQSPNTLTLRNLSEDTEQETVTQEQVDDLLGLDYESFLWSVLIGQFNSFFFDLTDTKRLNVFSGVLGLEFWEKCAEWAKDLKDEAAQEIPRLEGKADQLTGAVRELDATIEKLHQEIEDLRAQSAEHIEGYKEELALLQDERKIVGDRVKEAKEAVTRVRERLKKRKQEIQYWTGEVDEANDTGMAFAGRVARAQGEVSTLKKSLAHYKDAQCTRCKQAISRAHAKTQAESINFKVMDIETRLAGIRQEQRANEKRTTDAKNSRSLAIKALREVEPKLQKALVAHSKVARELEDCDHSISELQDSIVGAEGATAPLQERADAALVRRKERAKRAGTLRGKATKMRKEAGEFADWVKGFKDIRLWLIREAQTEFEIEVNNCLIELGLEDWEVTCDIERATARGGVSRGFQVFVIGPHNEKPVPWNVWCGGETQRLRIAGAMALSNMVRSRRGVGCNLEVWDEPTQHLSGEGVQDLLELMSERAEDLGRQIWIVDHRSLNYHFAGTVEAKLTESGTTLSALALREGE